MGNKRDRPPEGGWSWLELVRSTDRELLDKCRLDTFRGSGRGGQKRNKTSNAVRLTISDLAVTESTSRSRAQNITKALRKLRLAIALSLSNGFGRVCNTGPLPDDIRPYFSGGVIRINLQNPLFPMVVGNLVDLFVNCQSSWSAVAEACGVSKSQLRRFVEKHPSLLATVRRIQADCSKEKADTEGGEIGGG